MLALLYVAAGLVNNYPVKSINLATAESSDGVVSYYEVVTGQTIGLEDPHGVYGVALSDGGYLVVGKGGECETCPRTDAFAVKTSSTGAWIWTWTSANANADDAAIGATQLPDGGDVLVVGFRSVGGVYSRTITRLSLSTGSQVWQSSNFGDSAGSHGGFESIDMTTNGTAALVGGFTNKADTSEYSFRSYGNVAGGQAVVMQLPLSALTSSTAPTSASATWTRALSSQGTVKAARGLSNGEVGVLMLTDGVDTAQLVKLSSSGAIVWGPTNYGTAQQVEGTDMQISTDGSAMVFTGHGDCSGVLCGKLVSVSASDGTVNFNQQYASCGVPNACGTTYIKNECWGLQALSDGYVLSCGTGIENCDG